MIHIPQKCAACGMELSRTNVYETVGYCDDDCRAWARDYGNLPKRKELNLLAQ